MFDAILVSADPARRQIMQDALTGTSQVTVDRLLDEVSALEFARLLNVAQPDLFVVDYDTADSIETVLSGLRERSPSTAVLAFGNSLGGDSETAGRLGVEAVIPYPVDIPTLVAAIDRAIHQKKGESIENLYAFLPAKAGCGTTTLVLNTAARLASSLGKRTLVLEADLRSGVLDIMIGAKPTGGSQNVLELAGEIDTFLWENNITRAHGVEFLLTRRETGGIIPDWHHYHQVLNFAKSKYDIILVDLPELVNPATVEIVRRAASTFVTCTAEIAPLRLAKLRCEEIALWGAPKTRIRILLNRAQRGDMGIEELKQYTGQDVAAVFPNDYKTLREAMNRCSVLTENSDLGQAILTFAGQLAGVSMPESKPGLFSRMFR
jgi:pilus assembly protein CpaE